MVGFTSLLSDPDFLKQAATPDIAADTLKDPGFVKTAVVADRRDNAIADQGSYINDLKTLSYWQLDQKYGREVADNRYNIQAEAERQYTVMNQDRSTLEEVRDLGLGAGAAVTNLVGGISAATLEVGDLVANTVLPNKTTVLAEEAVAVAEGLSGVADSIRGYQTEKLQERNELSAIAGDLDKKDSADQFEADLQSGKNVYQATLERIGRDALDAGQRLMEDGAVASDILSQAAGSIAGSAKIAGAGARLAKGGASRAGLGGAGQAISATLGSSVGIGVTEATGVYTQTVNEVLSFTEEQMFNSPEYAELRRTGMDHNQAQRNIAASLAQEASLRQLPVATTFGLLAAKFNASPLTAFRGKGFMGGLREVGSQALEEAAQGSSGVYQTGAVLQRDLDPERQLSAGLGEEITLGAFGGAGIAGGIAAPRTAVGSAKIAGRGVAAGAIAAASAIDSAITGPVTDVEGIGSEAAATQQRAQRIGLVGTKAADILDTAATGAKKATDVAGRVTAPVTKPVVKAVKEVTAPVVEKVQKIADRPRVKTQEETIVAAQEVLRTEPENKLFKVVSEITTNLKETRVEDMEDKAVLRAAAAFNALRQGSDKMAPSLRRKVLKVLASNDIPKINERLRAIDLNKTQNETTAVTNENVEETIAVAQVNPANVNPEYVGKVLEQRKKLGLTDEHVKILELAQEIASVVDTHVGERVTIVDEEKVALSKRPDATPLAKADQAPTNIESTARSIQVAGYVDAQGKDLPSVNDLAADILEGVQSPDETVTAEGVTTPVGDVTAQLSRLVTHLRNKVEALNTSITIGGGKRVQFESLVGGEKLVPAGAPGGARGVVYHANSPGSAALAQSIHNDATAAAEVYNAIARAYPKHFPDGEIIVPDLLPGTTTPTTAVEAEVSSTTEETATKATTEAPAEVVAEEVVEGEVEGILDEAETETKETPDTTAAEESVSPEATTEAEASDGKPGFEPNAEATSALKELNDQNVGEFSPATADHVAEVEESIAAVSELLGADLGSRIKHVFLKAGKGFTGYAHWARGSIGLSQDVLDLTNPKKATHVIAHELAHVWDYMLGKGDILRSVADNRFSSKANGDLYQEIIEAVKKTPGLKTFFNYALNFKADGVKSQELFAELVAMYLMNPEFTAEHFPKGVAYVEHLIQSQTVAGTDSGSTASDAETAQVVQGPPTEKFAETFDKSDAEITNVYANGEEILNLLHPGLNTTDSYVEFANKVMKILVDGANKRLDTIVYSKKDGRTISEILKTGETLHHIRDYKNTMLVDPQTGQYDPNLVSIAAVIVADWMSSVRSADPHSWQLRQTLKALGVNLTDLNQEQFRQITQGVSPKLVAESLAKRIMKVWGVKVNPKSQLVDARGAVEGLVKEMIDVLAFETKYISLSKIPTMVDGVAGTTPTINVKPLAKEQEKIGPEGKDSVLKVLAPEEETAPSINEKITHVDKRNKRGTVNLSKTEQTALKTQQDTPHKLAKGVTGLMNKIGFAVISKMLGKQDVKHLGENHPLRNSIEGKNLSIQRDWDDAQAVADALDGNENASVYFRIGITQVGRHQHQGINSQNNKILRVVVAPTGDTLDMTNQDDVDGFWLTIAQASDLGSDFKVENVLHEKILATIQPAFAKEYGVAVSLIGNYLKTGELDENALYAATGDISMEQLNAIYAVADLNNQTKDGKTPTEFKVTLGFEVDGKTDGPAHMMNNFGQGLLTEGDYTNFQRVGYFLGTKAQTLNTFFSGGQVDLYNAASEKAKSFLYSTINGAGPEFKASLQASARFAEMFGDFQIGEDGLPEMTRNSTKNPMTQTVYGAGVSGVARGIAEDMVLEFYRKMIDIPAGKDPAEYLGYPDLIADFELLFSTPYPNNPDWSQQYMDKKSMGAFSDIIVEGIGQMITAAAKDVIGKPISRVNDLLVYITNVQTEFLQLLYQKRLEELAEKRASQPKGTEGWIDRNKQGKPIIRQLMVADFNALKKELNAYAPLYDNGDQALAIGSFAPQTSNQELSSTMRGDLQMKSNLDAPEIANVKVIPYLTQGRGDATVLNNFYGKKGAPDDTLAVHDGIYVKIRKIKAYAKRANEAVMEAWDTDVLGDVVTDFEGFLGKIGNDKDLLDAALEKVKNYPFESTTEADSANDLMLKLKEVARQNQARTNVFRTIPRGVDHLAGAGVAHTSGPDGVELDRHDINKRISAELDKTAATTPKAETKAYVENKKAMDEAAKKDKTEITLPKDDEDTPIPGVMVTNTAAILNALGESNRLTIKKTIQVLRSILHSKQFKVVIGKDHESLAAAYDAARGEGATESEGLRGSIGWADIDNDTMYILSNTHETLVHEMIHLATFKTVEAHYDGIKINPAIPRLETLMKDFMEFDFTGKGKTLELAAQSAKEAILGYDGNDSFSKTAALNEFMAWSLSNAALVRELKTRDTVLTRLTKAAAVLIKRILRDKIPTDMYSHILFNTILLGDAYSGLESRTEGNPDNNVIADATKIQREAENTLDENFLLIDDGDTIEPTPTTGDGGKGNDITNNVTGGNGNGSSGGVTPAAEAMTNFWIDVIKTKLEALKTGPEKQARRAQYKRYREAAQKAVTKLDFGGFIMSAYQKKTFKAIHMVLAMEMRLNTESAIALNKVFEYITTNLTPEMFGAGKDGQERYATLMDLLGDTKNDEGVSDAMAVLLAMSQTSKNFRNALDQLPELDDAEKINDGTFNEFLTRVTGMLMNKAVGTVDTQDGTAKELLDELAQNLLREDQANEYAILHGLMTSIDKADKLVSGAMSQLAERAAEADRKIQASDRSTLTKIVVGTVAGAAQFLSSERAEVAGDLALRVTHMGSSLDTFLPFRELVTEIIGTNATNAEVVAILDRTTYGVSAIRQDYREAIPIIFQDAFETHPDAEQWKATHKVLGKLDFATLFDLANPNRAFNLLKDNSLLSSKTAKAEADIQKAFSRSVSAVILEKANQLAGHMNGKGPGHQLWKNAYAINWNAGAYDPKMTKAIETLVALYALEIADQAQKDTVSEMYENDPEAVKNLVTYIQALNKEEEMKTISDTARLNGNQGWIPDHGTGNAQVIIARDDRSDELLKKGWIRVADASADSEWSTISRGYYTTTVKQAGNYSQGALQSVQGTYKGVNAVTGISVSPNYNGLITGREAIAATKNLNRPNAVKDDKEVLVPIYDETGVVYYERYINPDILEEYTKPRSNLALMLGAWAGRQVEEKVASAYNYELILELKRIYDARDPGDEGLYVDISNPAVQKRDAVYKDMWSVVSPDTRAQIKDVFGANGGFPVRKDQVNLALGYRDPSVMDIWTGKTRLPETVQTVVKAAVEVIPGDRAVEVLSRTEELVQGAVATAKDIIVVRSLIVPYMNTQANVFQLLARGLGTKQMIEGYKSKYSEIERFNVNQKKLIELKTKIALASNNPNRVAILKQQQQVIKDENARMSIAPMIEAGQYKNISEGITDLDVELTSGKMGQWMEAQVNRLPNKAQTIAKYSILSKDTAIYKAANKAVQYGDFLAKSILYDHYIAQGMDANTALRKIGEEFVNFSVLPGRTRTALESYGGTWFMSFKIRSMKVAMNLMRENPVRALILSETVGEYGSATEDNLATVVLQDRLPHAIGWDQLLGAGGLNPLVNMSGW
jgi:hypothetical protein